MPTATYTPLATITLSNTASAVTFGSIPNSFKDLVAVVTTSVGNTGAPGGNARNLLARLNGDTGNNYSRVGMSGDGSTARSLADTQVWLALDWYGHSNNGSHVHIVEFFDYAATNKNKSILNRVMSTNASEAFFLRWNSTAAITSISFLYDANTLAAGSTLSLYGIAG